MMARGRATRAVTGLCHGAGMPRSSLSPAETERRALQAAQRMLARGQRPMYRVVADRDGGWTVLEAPWLHFDRRTAARESIAGWLGCAAHAVDVEL
jgi:hypothetical protein